jgi:hypothetical protein
MASKADYWGPNLDRLVELKQKYDPTNVFKSGLLASTFARVRKDETDDFDRPQQVPDHQELKYRSVQLVVLIPVTGIFLNTSCDFNFNHVRQPRRSSERSDYSYSSSS